MKFNKYLCFLPVLLLIGLVGCDKDDYTGDSTLQIANPTATLAVDMPASMPEDGASIPFTITLDQPQVVDVAFYAMQSGGTATEDVDFDMDHSIIIPAYALSGSGSINFHADCDIEETETLEIQIGDNKSANVNLTNPQTISTSLTNSEGALNLVFDWSNTVSLAGTVILAEGDTMTVASDYELCDYVDLDVYVFDADMVDLGIYDAATGACPESMSIDGWEDGEYFLWTNMWANGLVPVDSTLVFPFGITVSHEQCGVSTAQSFPQSEENVITSADGTDLFTQLAKVTVTDGKATIEGL